MSKLPTHELIHVNEQQFMYMNKLTVAPATTQLSQEIQTHSRQLILVSGMNLVKAMAVAG